MHQALAVRLVRLRKHQGDNRSNFDNFQKEFSMSKFEVGEMVDNAADVHEGGTVMAVFPTVDGSFRYAVDMEGYGALQFFAEEKLVVHPSGTRAH